MTVFISWSGARSKAVALVFKEHLEHVIQGLPTFMSDKDIYSGTQWYREIGDSLRASTFGIICVTPDNTTSPWLNFEAGAIGNQTEQTRVAPVAIGMSKENLPSPLNGFNGVDLDVEGFVRLVKSIHGTRTEKAPWTVIEAAARRQWDLMEPELNKAPTETERPAAEFDLEGAVKEMRGLLRDLVEERSRPRVIDGGSVRALFEPSPAAQPNPPQRHPGGLVARVNSLLKAHIDGDPEARKQLLALGVDPDERNPLRDYVHRELNRMKMEIGEADDDDNK
jgi:hypothetical protein